MSGCGTGKVAGRDLKVVIEGCLARGDVAAGKELLNQFEQQHPPSIEQSILVIRLCALSGTPQQALTFFQAIPEPPIVAWRALLTTLSKLGCTHHALHLFLYMPPHIAHNSHLYIIILQACSTSSQVHLLESQIVEFAFDLHLNVCNALIHMYAHCGCLASARHVFDRLVPRSVVTWCTMISGYARHGSVGEALQLFHHMHLQNMEANQVTILSVLKACSTLLEGKILHVLILCRGMESHDFVVNSLLDMYAKCGSFDIASSLLDRACGTNVVMWTAMIGGCIQHGWFKKAFDYFARMLEEGVEPNEVTFVSMLKACSLLPDIDTVISGCCESSKFDQARHYFGAMQQQGIEPNRTTLSCLLFLCSHMGLLTEGFSFFKEMSKGYDASPKLEHFVSLVHLLGCTGQMDDAKCLLATMPSGPGPVGWRSLLSQCKAHSQVVLGQQCFEHVASGDQREAAGYVLMSNMYAHPGTEERAESEELRKYVNAWKKPAKACIEVLGRVHSFSVKDEYHPVIADIHAKLRLLRVQMVAAGHLHNWSLVSWTIGVWFACPTCMW